MAKIIRRTTMIALLMVIITTLIDVWDDNDIDNIDS